jgi:hypothetical protein
MNGNPADEREWTGCAESGIEHVTRERDRPFVRTAGMLHSQLVLLCSGGVRW